MTYKTAVDYFLEHDLGRIPHRHNQDVIALQETLMSAEQRFALEDYTTYRNDGGRREEDGWRFL